MAKDDADKAGRSQIKRALHATRRPYLLPWKLQDASMKVMNIFAENMGMILELNLFG